MSGEEYRFVGIPETIEEGPVSYEFTNKGEEPHELVLFRVNDGVEESVEDIVAPPQEEGMRRWPR